MSSEVRETKPTLSKTNQPKHKERIKNQMCIIALKPEGVEFSRGQLSTMWKHNPHGAGFMYADEGRVHVVKGLMSLDALVAAINAAGPRRKLVLHFRIKTHGAVSAELTHPFWVEEGKLAFVHNGIIRPLVNETSEKESDTAVFARRFGKAYSNPVTALRHTFHREMVEAYIGFSKMVFLEPSGRTTILNESYGTWDGEVWYSNDSYKNARTVTTSVTTTYSQGNTKFPWETGRYNSEDRKLVEDRLTEAFNSKTSEAGGGDNKVVHVTRARGSENRRQREERARSRELLGLNGPNVTSRWSRTPVTND